MNWSRKSAYVMTGEHGYAVAKFQLGDQARYRASLGGKFLGAVQDSFEQAAQVCENHLAIVGDNWEQEDE